MPKKVKKPSTKVAKQPAKKAAKKTSKKSSKKVSKKAVKKTAKSSTKSATKKSTKKIVTKSAKKNEKKSIKTPIKKVVKKISSVKNKTSKMKAPVEKVKSPKASTVATPLKSSSGHELKIGQVVPDMELPSTDGGFSFAKHKGQTIVLFFYPKDHTPGCTLEGHDFTNHLKEFANKNTLVFGVSKDNLSSHQKFITKQNYQHHLISDENEKLCQAFGVIKEKSMYGRTYLGIERSTFIINSNGVLEHAWRGVKVDGHVKEVLGKLK